MFKTRIAPHMRNSFIYFYRGTIIRIKCISNYQPIDDGNIFGGLSSTFASVYIIIMFRIISSQIGILNIILLIIFNQIK